MSKLSEKCKCTNNIIATMCNKMNKYFSMEMFITIFQIKQIESEFIILSFMGAIKTEANVFPVN